MPDKKVKDGERVVIGARTVMEWNKELKSFVLVETYETVYHDPTGEEVYVDEDGVAWRID